MVGLWASLLQEQSGILNFFSLCRCLSHPHPPPGPGYLFCGLCEQQCPGPHHPTSPGAHHLLCWRHELCHHCKGCHDQHPGPFRVCIWNIPSPLWVDPTHQPFHNQFHRCLCIIIYFYSNSSPFLPSPTWLPLWMLYTFIKPQHLYIN